MVIFQQLLISLIAAASEKPVWFRLDPSDRVRVLAALAVLLILAFGFILFARWGARFTRRYMEGPRRAAKGDRPRVDDWAGKPLIQDDTAGEDRA